MTTRITQIASPVAQSFAFQKLCGLSNKGRTAEFEEHDLCLLAIIMLRARYGGQFSRDGAGAHTYKPMYAPPANTLR